MSEHHNKSNASAFANLAGMKSEDLENLEKRLKEAKLKTSEFIRDYPLTSVAIGVGVGFLIGKLFSKK
jgi:ElaB/YqjD/DUF883 family membrane-anchored ribosome-binding protein